MPSAYDSHEFINQTLYNVSNGVLKSRFVRGDNIIIVVVVLCQHVDGWVLHGLQLHRRQDVVGTDDMILRIVCFINTTRWTLPRGIGSGWRILCIITRRTAHLPSKTTIFELFNAIVRQETVLASFLEAILFSLFGHPLAERTIAFVVLRNFAAAFLYMNI